MGVHTKPKTLIWPSIETSDGGFSIELHPFEFSRGFHILSFPIDHYPLMKIPLFFMYLIIKAFVPAYRVLKASKSRNPTNRFVIMQVQLNIYSPCIGSGCSIDLGKDVSHPLYHAPNLITKKIRFFGVRVWGLCVKTI